MICRDPGFIRHLQDVVFPDRVLSSIPYYKYNIAEAIAVLKMASTFCVEGKEKIYEVAFTEWADYETDFKPVSIYKGYDSGITVSLLSGIIDEFSKFEDALGSVQEVVDYYYEKYDDDVPEQELFNHDIFGCTADIYNDVSRHVETVVLLSRRDI